MTAVAPEPTSAMPSNAPLTRAAAQWGMPAPIDTGLYPSHRDLINRQIQQADETYEALVILAKLAATGIGVITSAVFVGRALFRAARS